MRKIGAQLLGVVAVRHRRLSRDAPCMNKLGQRLIHRPSCLPASQSKSPSAADDPVHSGSGSAPPSSPPSPRQPDTLPRDPLPGQAAAPPPPAAPARAAAESATAGSTESCPQAGTSSAPHRSYAVRRAPGAPSQPPSAPPPSSPGPRISPTRITSGFCRSTALTACAKLGVSCPTSICSTIEYRFGC